MKKDQHRLIREVCIYTLRSWGLRVVEQRSHKKYYSGFWCFGKPAEKDNFQNFINVAQALALTGATYSTSGEIAVGEVKSDKTYHSDVKDWYVNVSIELGEVNQPCMYILTHKMFDKSEKNDKMKSYQQTKRRKHK